MYRRLAIALIATALVITGLNVGKRLAAVSGTIPAKAEFFGSVTWSEDLPWFEGMSAIEVAANGQSATILSDRGMRVAVRLLRTDGRISGVAITDKALLRDAKGKKLANRLRDSEGLAVLPAGGTCVSFERTPNGSDTSVRCYDRMRGPGVVLPELPDRLPVNRGIEALAVDADGRLYAIPEEGRDHAGHVPVYRFEKGIWSVALRMESRGAFKPVGADIVGRDLYLLERAFVGIGFSSRLSRISLATGQAVTLLETGPGAHDNLEGLSIWRDATGRLVATMISDDNGKWFQRTEIVEYLVHE